MSRQGLAWGMLAGEGDWVGQGGRHPPALPQPQYGDFGAEGADLWLAASSDQRISIWAADWPRGCCELVDWLSSPSPTLTEVRVPGARGRGCGAGPSDHRVRVPPQAPSHPPPCLAAFCPWDGALLVCAGLSEHPELVFYNLRQKQARVPPPLCGAGSPRAPGLGRGGSRSLSTGGGEDPAAVLCRVPEPVPRGPPRGSWLCR